MRSAEESVDSGSSALATPPSISLYPLGDGGVLHRRGSHRLWALNASSAYLWHLLDRATTLDELTDLFATRFAIDRQTAQRDVSATLSAFAAEGLFCDLAAGGSPGHETLPLAACAQGPHLRAAGPWPVRQHLRLAGARIEVGASDPAILGEFVELTAHLRDPGHDAVDTHLAVTADGADDSWQIYLNGCRLATAIRDEQLLPELFTLLFVRASELLGSHLLFHAAAVGTATQALLFPAEAGSGKTTLVAALTGRGHRFFTDELAVVDGHTLTLSPLPLPMSIKPGSTAVLADHYPALVRRPVHPRADGQRVRYLLPPAASLPPVDPPPATIEALIFPLYRAGAATLLTPLDPPTALSRLAQTGSSDRELTAVDIAAMIALVTDRPCFALEYSRLAEATGLLEGRFASLGAANGRRPA